MRTVICSTRLLFALLLASPFYGHAAVIFTNGASWKYFIGTQEASSPASDWRQIAFDDSSWSQGLLPIGFATATNDPGGYEATIRTTLPTSAASNYVSVFLRKTFVVNSTNDYAQLRFSIVVDDGYAVWVNGREVGRYNIPNGEPAFNTLALSTIESTVTTVATNNPGAFLVPGPNVVAIQFFNFLTNNSDILLDVSLTGLEPDLTPPTITTISPPPGGLGSLSQINVTFSEPVTNVDAADLLINGQSASSLTKTNNSYLFTFVQPPFGPVQISWRASHGILDLGLPQNAFDATAPGTTWQYDLQDRVPPSATAVIPHPGFTVRSLTQIETHFSKPVTNLDASDLRINGNPATGLMILDPTRCVFSFPEPVTGTVQIAWSPGHGITDLASPPNSFVAGPGWTYLLNPNAAPPNLIITEFLAANSNWRGTGQPPANKLHDEDGDYSDWIEIFNAGDVEAELGGWFLTDDASRLTKWAFPQTNLAARAYMVVFASQKDRAIPGRPLHTNFRLSNNGEFLAIVKPDGITISSAFSPVFPPQIDDVSYGFPILAVSANVISNTSPASFLLPANGDLLLDWTLQTFDDSAWTRATNGLGFQTATNPTPSLATYVNTDLQSLLLDQSASLFVRIPFVIADASVVQGLKLRLRYDDGFVAYVNGQEVARANTPAGIGFGEPLPWDASASGSRINTVSTNSEEFDLSSVVRNGGVRTGTNVLAIHALNSSAFDGDFLIAAELSSERREVQLSQTRYFTVPTPGADNDIGVETLGPVVSDVNSYPQTPTDSDDILVTAHITPTFNPVGQVTLNYRFMYTPEVAIPMLDDGQHGDGLANDGVFGATIPAAAATVPGQMIRWYVRATDTLGRSLRLPAFADPLNSPQYFGTVVFLPQTNNLPILHWFMQNPASADSDTGTRGSLSYLGEFYDNVLANLHGQSSRGFPKHSYDLDFNPGNNFRYDPNEDRVDDINLLTTYPDKAKMRNMLSYGVYHDAGSPYHFVIPIRVQLNGVFQGDWHFVENGDENFLKRLGKDPNGALYKMYNTFTAAGDVQIGSGIAEKKTRKQEGNADLVDLMNGVRLTGTARVNYIYDNINIPEMVNFLASRIMTGDVDCCHKNYYFYRDTEGTGEWEGFPWDVDLSFGRVWNSTDNYWDPRLFPTTGLDVGNNNGVFSVILTGTTQTRQMYLRRIRTLMDELLGSPDNPLINFENQIDQWTLAIGPDAALDAVKWPFSTTWGNATGAGSPTSTCCTQTLQQAAAELKVSYLPQRRTYFYSTLAATLPPAQPANVIIQVRSLDYSPSSGDQAQEYIELFNTNTFAVDISGWKIAGGVDYTFRGGVVIPPSTSLYVAQDVRAWRARTTGPRGGQGTFVQGNYSGQLSARGETVQLLDKTGRIVHSLTYAGSPSLPQQYLRITELMYHPSPLAGNTNSPEAFEYIELKNIGPVALDLTGVRFVDGVLFDFTGSAVTNLPPGAKVVVVANSSAFNVRYGTGLPVAGVYTGNLENAGERIRLVDSVGEEILDFTYNNSWYPVTDGLGFGMVVVSESAAPDDWTHKEQWRPGTTWHGTPAQDEAAPPQFTPVLINEALTRTLNVPDSIELYNPSPQAVDISGWYLTDDLTAPQKFRIPDGTSISAGGFRVFDETQFNPTPGVPPSFALSSDGDEVYLFAAETNGNLTGYYHGFVFGAAEESVSFGRYLTSEGKEQFVAQKAYTPNASNAGPAVGPIVISELMYHPADSGDGTDLEFVELLNITANTVPLFDPALPTNTWHVSGGIDFHFPTNVSLAPGAAVLLVNFAPSNNQAVASFRANYSIDPSIQLFGPYEGALDNHADTVNLRKPTPPVAGNIPYALIDRVEYSDLPPWPTTADASGASLQRRNLFAYGNDPANWLAALPSPAAPTVTNAVMPQITEQPVGGAVLSGQTVLIRVTVTGTPPFGFQWRRNGTNVAGATSSTLSLANVQPQQSGDYQIIINNSGGTIFSDVAHLTVRNPVAILQQPQDRDVLVFPDPSAANPTNVTFNVVAYSVAPVRYQWQRNGAPIPNATNATYTVVNVKTNDLATFSVTVSDDISSAQTPTFWLYPLIQPSFIENPISQTVPVGSIVTLSAQASGWPPPFTFEWRVGTIGVSVITNVQNELVSFYSFRAPSTVVTQTWRAVVRNRANTVGRGSVATSVITLADTDGDGIPDNWENKYQFNTNNAADGLADPDGDGMLNWQEYQAGTDPTNALSNLKLISTRLTNNVLRLQFQSVSNRTYAIQQSGSLDDTNWPALARFIARRTNRTEVITFPLTNVNQFYRIVTPTVP